MAQLLWKTVWRFLKKLRLESPYKPVIPFLSIYPKKTKILIQKDTCTPIFSVPLFVIAKIWTQSKCSSMDEWIMMQCMCTKQYYSAIKKKKDETTWIDLEGIMLNEISQMKKDKCHMFFSYEEYKK